MDLELLRRSYDKQDESNWDGFDGIRKGDRIRGGDITNGSISTAFRSIRNEFFKLITSLRDSLVLTSIALLILSTEGGAEGGDSLS